MVRAGVSGPGRAVRVVQRRAWQWALANRRPNGSLHGAEVARHAGKRRTRLLTFDERGFRPMRALYGPAFTLLPADAELAATGSSTSCCRTRAGRDGQAPDGVFRQARRL